jgi:hypothetical protein
VKELAAGTDADVARIAAAAIQLARAPEQHRPLAAVRDLSTSPRTHPTTASPARRAYGGDSPPAWRPPTSSTVNAAVSATEG